MTNPFDIIVPAAGIGSRMATSFAPAIGDEQPTVDDRLAKTPSLNTRIPKQYLPLLDIAILERTLAKLLSLGPRTLCLVVAKHDNLWKTLPSSAACKIVIGGETRAESVEAGLLALEAQDDSLVLVHDAVRPLFDIQDVKRLIAEVDGAPMGGLLATRVIDTLKKANAQGYAQQTPDRSEYWQAQTPQAFPAGLLREALQQARAQQHTVTDEASAVEALGIYPKLVSGSKNNIKITTVEDLALAEFLLKRESEQ